MVHASTQISQPGYRASGSGPAASRAIRPSSRPGADSCSLRVPQVCLTCHSRGDRERLRETLTLENNEPLVLADLLAEYENYVRDNGVLPVPVDYQQIKQAARNGLKKRYLNPIKAFAVSYGWMIAVALIAIIVLIRRKRQSGPV